MPALFARVRELAADTPGGIFQVPPYFAYVAKSFSVLEGIGLSVDPNYSIVDETLPYISQRILTDPSPRTAGALETFLFGDNKEDVASRVLDAGRVATLVDGARRYANTIAPAGEETAALATTAAAPATTPSVPSSALTSTRSAVAPPVAGPLAIETRPSTPVAFQSAVTTSDTSAMTAAGATDASLGVDVEEAADAILDLVFSAEPSPLQDVAIEQAARLVGAVSREQFGNLRKASGSPQFGPTDRSLLGVLVDPLGIFRASPLVNPDATDREALSAASQLADLATQLLPASAGTNEKPLLTEAEVERLQRSLAGKLWSRRQDLALVSRRFAAALLDQTAARVYARK